MMAKFPTYEEMGKKVAEKALDEFLYNGKSIREWMQIITAEDAVSRQAVLNTLDYIDKTLDEDRTVENYKELLKECYKVLPPITPQSKIGHWGRKIKVDTYDIEGVKTWGIKCQCDKCDFSTIVVEDFGYYKYCPNCGAKMIESQESEAERDKELENPFNDCRFGG